MPKQLSILVLSASAITVVGCGRAPENPVYIDDEVPTPSTSALVVPFTTLPPITTATEVVVEEVSLAGF